MSSRIFYALQQVTVGGTVLSGVQSVGASSTTNIENFSRFGSTGATTILQDLDLEITVENALGNGWDNILTAVGMGGAADAGKSTTVKIEYLTSTGVTKSVTLDAIISSYSMQMGVDGPATESVTFQNNGNAVFTAGTDGTTLGTPTGGVCAVITRPSFSGYQEAYSDNHCSGSPTWTSASDSNLLSVSASMDIGTEKVNVLGQSLSFGKYVTFPIETSMETEVHLDPESGTYGAGQTSDDGMGGFMSGTIAAAPNDKSLVDRLYRTLIKLPGNYYGMSGARLTGVSRSGGDVGGGQVSITSSFSSVNDLFYSTTDPSSDITGTNFPAA
jgi:hypothetical protein